jgi:hypothetical protein
MDLAVKQVIFSRAAFFPKRCPRATMALLHEISRTACLRLHIRYGRVRWSMLPGLLQANWALIVADGEGSFNDVRQLF